MTAYTLPVLFGGTAPGLNNVISNPYGLEQTREFWQDNCQPSGRLDACTIYAYGVHYGCDGCTHPGSDVDTGDPGDPGNYTNERLYAVTDGVVDFAGPDRYYCPAHVDIKPTVGPYRNEIHIYGHMSSVSVSTGASVRRGQLIGFSSGVECGCGGGACPHVHWERRVPGSCSSGYCSEQTHGATGNGPLTDANANGSVVNPPPDPVPTNFKYGDVGKATSSINVRATPAGAVVGTMTTGNIAEILGEATVTASLGGTSYSWVFVNLLGRNLKGWVATTNLSLFRANRIANPTLQSNTVNIVEYKPPPSVVLGRTSSSRNLVATGGAATAYTDYWLTVTCDGSQPFAGAYFRSPDINSNGLYKTAWGHISLRNVSASDSIKYVGIRLIYDTGPPTDKWHTSQPTGATEQRISIPPFNIDPNRKLVRAQWYTFGANDSNPRSWEANRAIVYLSK